LCFAVADLLFVPKTLVGPLNNRCERKNLDGAINQQETSNYQESNKEVRAEDLMQN
jgi:hypothetical protein